MLSKGLLPALLETSSPTASARAQSLQELIHCHRGNYFSFAMEATLPESTVATLVERVPTSVQKDQKKWPHRLRYEVSFEVFN
jgi:hypothetical protein